MFDFANRRQSSLRAARFESFEDRLVLSGQPVGDFSLDDLESQRAQNAYSELAPMLADAHALTGVDNVHDQYGFMGAGQTVAVIDSGIAWDHVALGAGLGSSYRVVGGWDFTENDADPYDDGPSGFHGTHVAGIVGASGGVHEGVAPGVDLVGLRVFDDQGAGYFSWVEDALQWVHENQFTFENPITTVNLSLGTNWNSDSIPAWATLEDEFAQLEADGIFVAVASGNSFASFNEAGLSYPAASPYVVPVASIDSNGLMSGFSQRSDRVLAAPGAGIVSTVPDHVFGSDGNPNDYATASGTSMASPYVAGASVLVRQAMEFVGYQDITQDAIYDHFRDTADPFFDAVTNSTYLRINVQSALDALMPSDDFGSTTSTAHSLGSFSGQTTLSGLIGTLNDHDVFSFTAAQSGTFSVTTDATHELVASWLVDGSPATISDGVFSFDVIAGQTYSLDLATAGGIGYYDLDMQLDASMTDWGAIQSALLDGQSFSGESWARLTAGSDGLLTVEALFEHAGGNIDLEIYDANGNLIASSNSSTDNERMDVEARAGDSFLVRVRGANQDVQFRLTNLVQQIGGSVIVNGTAGDDSFGFAAGEQLRVSVNGVEYSFDSGTVDHIQFAGGGGHDVATIVGGEQDDSVVLRAGSIEMRSEQYEVFGEDIERFDVNGGGGNDRAYLYGTAGDEQFVAYHDNARMTGDVFVNRVEDFDRVNAYGGGGNDTAYLYDSIGNDRFYGRANYSWIQGNGFLNYAQGFDRVNAYSIAGGHDTAHLNDTAGDDRFFGRAEYSWIQGDGYLNYAEGFDSVYAYATGGNDAAQINDTTGDDRFFGRHDASWMIGSGVLNYARGFDRVYANSIHGGNDTAYLYDTSGDERFIAGKQSAWMVGNGFFNHASGFDRVNAYASGGQDVAYLYDTAGNEQFFGRAAYSWMQGDAFLNYAQGFDRVNAYARAGGYDTADFSDSAGNDRFYGRENYSWMVGSGFLNYAEAFDRVNARSIFGGNDAAFMNDSAGDDLLFAGARETRISGRGFSNSAEGFRQVDVHSTGGVDRAIFDEVGQGDDFFKQQGVATVVRANSRLTARGFDSVAAYDAQGDAIDEEFDALDELFSQLAE